MFKSSRRRRAAPVQPLTKETANPHAATAAASAFMRRDPNQSLSSAAAAAALRARPTTPTNVAEVPSKRVRRRNSSISSVTSRDGGRKGELQRSPSVGSMIERTFRSPSPGRGPALRTRGVPPVPSIPVAGHVAGTMATGLQTQPFRTASQKMKDGQQGSWFGAATARDPTNVNAISPAAPEPRPGSASPSINFSYPRARMLSPGGDPLYASVLDQDLVYDANSRRMVPRGELVARSLSAGDFSVKPIKKKKRQDVSSGPTYLSKGTVGRTAAMSYVDSEPSSASVPSVLPEHMRESSQVTKEGSETPPGGGTHSPPGGLPIFTARPPLAQESEQGEVEQHQDGQIAQSEAAREPLEQVRSPTTGIPERIAGAGSKSRAGRVMVQSEDEVRSAHFASPTDQLVVKHEPPPRSLSPRKSAMKLSNATKTVSPAPSSEGSEASGFGLSQGGKEDPATARKKSVRVSWDDKSTIVVGESAQLQDTESPIISSPHENKPWHSIVGKHTKEMTSPGEDETMSPRPALPLFGSVREKKTKEPEERPLVRPHERTWSPKPAPSPPQMGAVRAPTGLVQSSGSTVGAIPAQEQSSKNEANTSKYREPLPAVASVEAPEHDSADSLSSGDELDMEHMLEHTSELEGSTVNVNATGLPPNPGNAMASSKDAAGSLSDSSNAVSTMAASQPSIGLQNPESDGTANGFTPVPGSFPRDGGVSDVFGAETELRDPIQSTPAQSIESTSTSPSLKMDDITEEDESSDRDSVYSDAYEDLSQVGGDGFMSLDAVLVTTPDTKSNESPSNLNAANGPAVPESQPRSPFQASDDWENAKAYWKSLSSDKRRQLEKEALAAENGVEGTQMIASELEYHGQNGRIHPQIKPGTTGSWDHLGEQPNKDFVHRAAVNVAVPSSSTGSPMRINEPSRGQLDAIRQSASSGVPPLRIKPRQDATPTVDFTAGGQMRKSLRPKTPSGKETNGLGRGLGSAGRRASSSQPAISAEPAQKHQRNQSADGSASRSNGVAAPSMRPSLRRRGSDSSESSFTRTRTSPGPRHGFRISMRGSMREPTSSFDSDKGSGRCSLRSLSPTGSAFGRNSVSSGPLMGGRMRQSLRRGSSNAESPRAHISGFGRWAAKESQKSRSGSRFADSSDDDDDHRPAFFRSRYADSSDEDESPLPKSLRGKSPDEATGTGVGVGVGSRTLEKGSPDVANHDNIVLPKRTASSNGLPGVSSVSALQPSRSRSGRGGPSRRGSFMSILRRKRNAGGRVSRETSESATRRDTGLERSSSLGNRGPGWPLPGDNHADDGEAASEAAMGKPSPSTAGGPKADAPLQSGLLGRRSTSQDTAGLSHVASDGTPAQRHKKKRFGSLRKMFGLYD